MSQERLRHCFHLVPVLVKDALGFGVGVVDQPFDFLIDDAGGVVGIFLSGEQRFTLFVGGVLHEAQPIRHAPFEHHGPGEVGGHANVHRGATGDVVGVALLGDPATAQHPKGGFDVFPAVAVAVFFGQRERCPHRLAPRDDGDLVDRVGIFKKPLNDGVSGLVVGGGFAFLFFNPPTATSAAVPDLVAGFFEILQLDEFLARQGCDDRGFVDQRGQLSPREHRGATGDAFHVDIGGHADLAGVDAQNLTAAFDVGQHHLHSPVEATWAGQRRVEHVGPVGGRNHNDLVLHLEAIHFNQDGVQCLFAFVVAAA